MGSTGACGFLLMAALAAGARGVSAQGPSTAPANPPIPQLHADAPEIVLDLIARDKKNRPVMNLNASDIAVTDAGTPVPLRDLHLVTAQAGARTRIALLFDNMSPEAAKSSHNFADRLLAEAPMQTEFAVLGVDRGLRLVETYTADRAALKAAVIFALNTTPARSPADAEKTVISIVQTGAFPGGKVAGVDERAEAKLMLGALEDARKLVVERRVAPSLAAILALVQAESGLTGRQIVLFFSEGISTTSQTNVQSKNAVETANRAGVAIYTVNSMGVASKSLDEYSMPYHPLTAGELHRGTVVAGTFEQSFQDRITQEVAQNGVGGGILQQDSDKANGNLLEFLANGTGGFAISTGDDPRRPLKRLLTDVGSYYEASYTPPTKQDDGSFHSLNVRALRAGVTVRARSGYFAVSAGEEGLEPIRASEAPLVKLLTGTAPGGGIAFEQAALEVADNAQGRVTDELAVEVPVANLGLRSDDQTGLYAVRASILAEVKDKSGVVVERFQHDVSRNGALESLAAARSGCVTLQWHFDLPPGAYSVETALLDHVSGKAGVERTDFTVPPARNGPWLSDMVMLERTQPIVDAPDPLEPLLYHGARVVPSIDHRVQAGASQIVFLARVRCEPTAGDAALALDVDRDGSSLMHSVSRIRVTPNALSSLNVASIDAAKLSAGTYRATLTLTQGTASQARSVDFTVDGNPGVKPAAPDFADEDTDDYPADGNPMVMGKFQASPDAVEPSALTRKELLDGARERADGFLGSLMDFRCLEITDRYVDHKGNGKAHHDRIVEQVTSENRKEARRLLQVNGKPSDADSVDMSGARLEGAFGGVLQIVFEPQANAHFQWKQSGFLDGAAMQVFSYSVDAKHSLFLVNPMPADPILVPFHGMVFIDAATHGVRRITLDGDNIPARSHVHATGLSIDYDYVTMNDHDYLVPVGGEFRMQIGKSEKILHRIEFRDYHRFGSQLRIVSVNP